ncbi:MAG: DUF5074 domain-containing protein [Muribaculaceae bacterium]|nr:DUF5074 domain-containing protein [Muribaculaceae bacterium]
MKHFSLVSILCALQLAFPASMQAETDYSTGILWVNEDWYGHQNSTVNYLLPDDPEEVFWSYRVIQSENPGMELGCTNQYGAIWDGRLYLIAKQDKDPGASIAGGRITVADARTLKILHQQALIDPSGAQCDGRGFLGVDVHKGYVSSSNGVWIFDLDKYEVIGQVAGTENPNVDGNSSPNTNPGGSLYHGQSGMMVQADGKVFVAHQQYGLLVVDPLQDRVVKTISMDIVRDGAGIGSIVKSKDGMLWLSIAANTQGSGSCLNKLLRIDPKTLDPEIIDVPEGMYAPSNSWYAWTPDAFVASQVRNCLLWKGGPNSWFSGTKIYIFDCDTRKIELLIDLEQEGANWKLYGCALGVHPRTDEIYMALYHEFGTPTYITRRYSPEGTLVKDYPMIANYWFPSLPVFTEGQAETGVENALIEDVNHEETVYDLRGVPVLKGTDLSEHPDLPSGIYIRSGASGTRKILIR